MPKTRIASQSPVARRGLVWQSASQLALFAALVLPRLAHADAKADSERANALFKKGKKAFNESKYSDALRIYGEAWQLKKSPDIAANLAQTEAEVGQHRDAAEHYAYALAHLLPSSTDEQKKALADGLEAEKQRVGTLRVTIEPAEAALRIDDTAVTLPSSGEVFVEPGDHQTLVTLEGYEPNRQSVHVLKGTAPMLWIKLVQAGAVTARAPQVLPARSAAAVELPSTPVPESRRSIVPVVVGGALVVVGVAVGVGFLLSGNSNHDDADAIRAQLPGDNACGAGTPDGERCAQLHDHNESVDRARTLEVTGFTVAGAAAVGTAIYLLWPRSDAVVTSHAGASRKSARSLTPALTILPDATTLSLAGRF